VLSIESSGVLFIACYPCC